jgi:hypothetical protein
MRKSSSSELYSRCAHPFWSPGPTVQGDLITPLDRSPNARSDSSLYTDFASDIRWIKECIREEYETLPPAMRCVAHYYLTQRVKVLHDHDPLCPSHHLSPRPIPYLAFWFAHDFGLKDTQVRRLLGLSLVYVCLSSSPRDDLLDGSGFAPGQQTHLTRWFWERHLCALRKLFSAESPIWHLVSKSTAEWERGDRWALSQSRHEAADPLSATFLRDSSRYLAAMLFATLAAVVLLSNQAKKVSAIRRFVCYYCMGWRILDDLRDWRDDLEANIDTSSVLGFLRIRAGIPRSAPLTRALAVSLFSDHAVVSQIYSAMAGFCLAARREAEKLQAGFVTRFIDEQLLGYEAELARIRAERAKFENSLDRLLEAHTGISKRVANKNSREKRERDESR